MRMMKLSVLRYWMMKLSEDEEEDDDNDYAFVDEYDD